ncbi:MAG: rane protein-like protein [Actinomycetia bacterium]|nr:rane protein-like protein [Actinomycetes bacterium]
MTVDAPPRPQSSSIAGRDLRSWGGLVVPALTGLLAGLWGIGSPSYWRDEAATLEVARFSLPDTFHVLSHVDAVHGAYYLFMHVVVGFLGGGETATRLPSVLAAGAAAAGTAALGRRLAGPSTGLVAGLIVALSPTVTRYAQEARSYTIVMALAVLATFLFVRALDMRTRQAFAAYAVAMAAVVLVHGFALLLLPVHALVLWRQERMIVRRWVMGAGAALVVDAPLFAVDQRQSHAISWIAVPTLTDVRLLVESFAGSAWLIAPVLVLIGFGLWRRRSPDTPVDLRLLAVAWALVPPVLLLGISLVHPVYVFRYVLFCVPALALLAAAGLTRLPRWPAVTVGVLLVALSIPQQLAVRGQATRQDDLHRLAVILRAHERTGDAVVYCRVSYRHIAAAYPDVFTNLRDVGLLKPAAQAGNLNGVEVPYRELSLRLKTIERVWFIKNTGCAKAGTGYEAAKLRLLSRSSGLRLTGTWSYHGGQASLFERRA